MGHVIYTQSHINLGAVNSDLTGRVWFVGDATNLTVSIQTSTGSASRYTIVGNNDNGMTSALGTPSAATTQNGWSIVTVLTSAGLYSITPGFRWINSFRSVIDTSAASNVTVTFVQRVG